MPQSAITGVEWQDAMNQLRTVDVQEIMARAGKALSKASGGTVVLGQMEVLSNDHRRNFIARAAAGHTDGSTRSVIVKATRSPSYDPTHENVLQASGLVKEWVACAFLAARAPGRGHGSALLAGDVAGGIMVFEDLGADLASLVDPLLKGTAQEAERALKLYATALGRLHADTVGCLDGHHEALQFVFGSGRSRRPPGWRVEKDAELVVNRLGGTPSASELELLSSRLSDPGPWLTLIHGDPCPDNALLVDQRIRLIDYEFARPSHALLDGIYWRMGFRPAGAPDAPRPMSPPAWMRLIGPSSALRSPWPTRTLPIASSSPTWRRSGFSHLCRGDWTRRSSTTRGGASGRSADGCSGMSKRSSR
jgi:hypothetical protein